MSCRRFVAALVLLLPIVPACRFDNPAFRATGALARSDPDPSASAADTTSDKHSETQEPGNGSAPPMASSSTAQTSSSGSSTQLAIPGPICHEDADRCYAMNFDSDETNYPDQQDQSPAIVHNDANALPPSQDPNSIVFEHFLSIRSTDRYAWAQAISLDTQQPQGYGVGISLRKLDCEGPALCELLVLGALRIHYEKRTRELHCSVRSAQSTLTSAKVKWTPGREIDLYCSISNNLLRIRSLEERPPAVPFNPFGVYNKQSLELELGALGEGPSQGRLIAEVGRLQYWRDPRKMP